jgi:hypothetical protein
MAVAFVLNTAIQTVFLPSGIPQRFADHKDRCNKRLPSDMWGNSLDTFPLIKMRQ